MFGDTALIRLVIEGLVKSRKWSYEEALEKFYTSDTCRALSDERTGMFTFAPREIIELLNEEYSGIVHL
jgi:hypothetical protein